MYLIYGKKVTEEKELWAGKATCPCCSQESDFYVRREITSATAFFIPVFSFTTGREVVCENCGSIRSLSRKEYKAMRQKQVEMIENDTYPREKALVDFSPENVRFIWSTIKLIIKGLIALFFLSPLLLPFTNTGNTTGQALLVCLFLLPVELLFVLPFYFSLKRYRVLLKMKKAYNKLTNI